MPSDIQVFVRFQDHCVFAGEELRCTITFKNVANYAEPPTPGPNIRRQSRTLSIGKLPLVSPRPGEGSLQSPKVSKPSYPPSAMKNTIPSVISPSSAPLHRPGHKHQRSVSIISIGSPTTPQPQEDISSGQASRPAGGHRRSSTIQVYAGHSRRPSQYRETATGLQIPPPGGRRSPLSSTSASTPVYESRRSTPDFQFPLPPQQDNATQPTASRDPSRDPSPRTGSRSAVPTRLRREPSNASRATSERSSGEFYSLSNHSQETLMSEQPSVPSERPRVTAPSAMMRRHYRIDSQPPTPRKPQPQPVNLLMGYAHLAATFTVDGSLVDQSSFEEVKRKGFLGGQAGGGVVGVAQKKPRPNSGFLGGFNFNSIGESLNSLVGGDNMSSVREMNAVTNSRAIPLLSTPQSLLFVNLHLDPGEEKSYSFSSPVPRGLPSSYRGKAIKIAYNVQVGVQTAPTGARDRDHKVRQISVPVRVFSGVDSDGEILGHDLMQPHVLLRDPARTASADDIFHRTDSTPPAIVPTRSKLSNPESFLTFIDTLLDRSRRRHSSAGSMLDAVLPSADDSAHPTVAAINRAVLLSNRVGPSSDSSSSSNRFNITRMGQPVAVITLSRALFRLGETITTAVALAPSDTTSIRVATLHATLETSEKVAQSLAIRSATSIARVTRRVYGSWSGNVLFSKRAVFSPTVPIGAAPTFVTSGVELSWGIRFEFGVVKSTPAPQQEDGPQAEPGADEEEQAPLRDSEGAEKDAPTGESQLFEEVVTDERGVVSIAVERLECESFEVVIPITVYGDIGPGRGDSDDVPGISI